MLVKDYLCVTKKLEQSMLLIKPSMKGVCKMWTCTLCGREFKRKNQSHYCKSVNTIEEYIAQFSNKEQVKLQELRKIIKNIASEAEEKISWKMPTYFQNGNLVHFAMQKPYWITCRSNSCKGF